MRTAVLRVVCVLALLTAVGCSNDSESGPSTSQLNIEQATRLSRVLVDNYDRQGATFNARLDDGSLNLAGEIDWQGHFGHAVVTATGSESGVTEVYWSSNTVVERRPELEGQTVGDIVVPAWIARPPDPTNRQLDNIIAVLTALAGTTADNPLLVQQTQGTALLEVGEVRGVAAEAMRYAGTAVYWLAADDGRMLQLDGGVSTLRPFTIDIITFGAQTIDGPQTDEVIDVAQIQDLYDATLS